MSPELGARKWEFGIKSPEVGIGSSEIRIASPELLVGRVCRNIVQVGGRIPDSRFRITD